MKFFRVASLSTMLATALAGAAAAHHSVAMYEGTRLTVLEGTLKKVQLTNPHVWFVIAAPAANGVVSDWDIQGPSPNNLIRRGWKRADLNPGDKVAFTIHPRKDGVTGGIVVSVRLADGRELMTGIGKELPR